jgi:hypothetical protein
VDAALETLEGAVERITYYNAENGYSVVRLRPRRGDVVTVVGNLPEVQPGESLRLTGSWGNHPQFGQQFKAETCQQLLPATMGPAALPRLRADQGRRPAQAERIVKRLASTAPRSRGPEHEGCRASAPGAPRTRGAWRAHHQGVMSSSNARREHRPGGQDLQAVRQRGDPDRAARSLPPGARSSASAFRRPHRHAHGPPHDAPAARRGVFRAGAQVSGHVFVRARRTAPAASCWVDPG